MNNKSKAFGDFQTLTTPEAILRHALEYFETTEKPSLNYEGWCSNRGPHGSCCVFGSAIPDDHPNAGDAPLADVDEWLSLYHSEVLPRGLADIWEVLQLTHDRNKHWSSSGGLNVDGVSYLEYFWNHYLPDVPFPGYNYRGAR